MSLAGGGVASGASGAAGGALGQAEVEGAALHLRQLRRASGQREAAGGIVGEDVSLGEERDRLYVRVTDRKVLDLLARALEDVDGRPRIPFVQVRIADPPEGEAGGDRAPRGLESALRAVHSGPAITAERVDPALQAFGHRPKLGGADRVGEP